MSTLKPPPPDAAHPPSPMMGEGGVTAPGEGETANTTPANPKAKRTRKLRKEMTDTERKLWSLLRNRKLSGYKFRGKVPVGPYITDFLCFEARLIVEADGRQHADTTSDAKRYAWFGEQGFTVIRFWNNDVFDNAEGVLSRLASTLETHKEIAR